MTLTRTACSSASSSHFDLDSLIVALKALFSTLPDRRQGDNTMYSMRDFGSAAFAVFFTQSPSFLAQQTALQRGRGTDHPQRRPHFESAVNPPMQLAK